MYFKCAAFQKHKRPFVSTVHPWINGRRETDWPIGARTLLSVLLDFLEIILQFICDIIHIHHLTFLLFEKLNIFLSIKSAFWKKKRKINNIILSFTIFVRRSREMRARVAPKRTSHWTSALYARTYLIQTKDIREAWTAPNLIAAD